MPRKVFVAGEILTAADVNTNLMDQAVMSFAGTAARGSAIPSPVEGMVTYLNDSDSLQVYTTDWVDVAATPGTAIVFTSNGTFSKGSYPGLKAIRVSVIGGGGGGGGSDVNNRGGGGGGGGAFTQKVFNNIGALDASISVTVGAAGTASGVGNGSAGGSSSFGSLLEAGGGAGGANPGASSNIAAGGTVVTGGDINLPGAEGGASFGSQNEGGDSFWGFGGKYLQTARVTGAGNDAGRIGFGYGAGGAGGYRGNSNGSGSNGLPGVVIVETFS